MATYTPESTSKGYSRLWDNAQITPEARKQAESVARKGLANKAIYEDISAATNGVPYFWIAPVHYRESSMNLERHLHCGDPLTARTYHVPKGRPKAPPANGVKYTFKESAVDALVMPPHSLSQVTKWSVERMCYEWERYNGWGYRTKLGNPDSPYLAGGTTEQDKGKYVADGQYDPNAMDKQLGCIAIAKALAEIDPTIARQLQVRENSPPADVIAKETKGARNARNTGAAAGATGGAGEAVNRSTEQPPPVWSGYVTIPLVCIGIAVFVVGLVLVRKHTDEIKARWF